MIATLGIRSSIFINAFQCAIVRESDLFALVERWDYVFASFEPVRRFDPSPGRPDDFKRRCSSRPGVHVGKYGITVADLSWNE